MKLPRLAVWEPKIQVCRKPAMKLPRLAVWEPKIQVCRNPAMKLPRLAVWEPKIQVCRKPAMKLPRLAGLRTSISSWMEQMAEKWLWNCKGQQFEFQKPKVLKTGPETAKFSSSMATFSNCPIWQVCPRESLIDISYKQIWFLVIEKLSYLFQIVRK